MPIIVGGKPLDISKLNQKVQEKIPEPILIPVETSQKIIDISNEFSPPPKRVVFDRKKTPKITDGNTLIVNGKAKTIGRKSQFLLDMMIIDDE
jgi:hypothetical protein